MVSGNVRDAHESYLHCLGTRRMGGGQPKKWNILYLHGQPHAERVIYGKGHLAQTPPSFPPNSCEVWQSFHSLSLSVLTWWMGGGRTRLSSKFIQQQMFLTTFIFFTTVRWCLIVWEEVLWAVEVIMLTEKEGLILFPLSVFLTAGWQVGIVSPANSGQLVKITWGTGLKVFQAAARFRAKVCAWLAMSAIGEAGLKDKQYIPWPCVAKHA